MKAVVLAYHDMGCAGIEALLRHGFEIAAVFTHKDDPRENVWFGSVAELAAARGLPVYAPDDINHPLWVTWLKWRVRTLGDWWVDVRRTLNKVSPNISILTYTTHSGITTNTSLMQGGNDLFEKARACDFLGTEIMSRNVFDCYRPVYAYRKLKAALGRYFGSPIYGLVYHLDDPYFAYAGWALCQMNGQATWMSTIEGQDMKRYIDWPEQMDGRHAQSVADIAVLFSNATRQFNRLMSQVPDAVGLSE